MHAVICQLVLSLVPVSRLMFLGKLGTYVNLASNIQPPRKPVEQKNNQCLPVAWVWQFDVFSPRHVS
jgi:hypothetical protein